MRRSNRRNREEHRRRRSRQPILQPEPEELLTSNTDSNLLDQFPIGIGTICPHLIIVAAFN